MTGAKKKSNFGKKWYSPPHDDVVFGVFIEQWLICGGCKCDDSCTCKVSILDEHARA